MDFKQNFFEDGFISKLRVLSDNDANNIYRQYLEYLDSGLKKAETIEHKTKSHLYFPWANELIKNEKLLNYVEKILGPNFGMQPDLLHLMKLILALQSHLLMKQLIVG